MAVLAQARIAPLGKLSSTSNHERVERVKMMFLVVKLIRFILAAVNVMLAPLLSDTLDF